MGTGKSTVGPILAQRLGLPFIDTDAEIERVVGKPVPVLWREEGEAAFRAREGEVIARLLADDTARVLAFGGGAVTVDRTRRLALDRAVVVTLTASPETIASRVGDARPRPNLAVGSDPATRARELMTLRAPAYAECHMALSTDATDPDGAVDAIDALL